MTLLFRKALVRKADPSAEIAWRIDISHQRSTATVERPNFAPSGHTDRPHPPRPHTMAAAIKALNAKIRSNKYTDYICSTRTCLPCGCWTG